MVLLGCPIHIWRLTIPLTLEHLLGILRGSQSSFPLDGIPVYSVEWGSIWSVFIPTATVILIKCDGTPMQLDIGGSLIRSEEVVVRCMRAYRKDGTCFIRSPVLNIAPNK